MNTKTIALLAAVIAAASGLAAAADVRPVTAFTFREGDGVDLDLIGTAAAPGLAGTANVKRNQGRTRVKLRLPALGHPQRVEPLYTTYVLWAVAPGGRAESLAELEPSRPLDMEVTTSLPGFALVVTAEPFGAVRAPSGLVVAESRLGRDEDDVVVTPTEFVGARPSLDVPRSADFLTPLLVLGARRAVELARAEGAVDFADLELREAEVKLQALEQLSSGKKKLSKDLELMARDIMARAESARELTAQRRQQAGLAAERREARDTIAQAESDADAAREESESYRQALARAEREAAAARARVAQAQTEADRARADEELARAEAERARLEAEQSRRDKAALEQRLFESLNAILETRREARGLIVNLSDVLFDFNKASLKPGAREKLSRLAGVLLAYPGPFRIEIEGHTDSVGSDEYNLTLSRDRAESVNAYLGQAGVPRDRVVGVKGLGEERPVATNDTAAGRQLNRRVEIVISDTQPRP